MLWPVHQFSKNINFKNLSIITPNFDSKTTTWDIQWTTNTFDMLYYPSEWGRDLSVVQINNTMKGTYSTAVTPIGNKEGWIIIYLCKHGDPCLDLDVTPSIQRRNLHLLMLSGWFPLFLDRYCYIDVHSMFTRFVFPVV